MGPNLRSPKYSNARGVTVGSPFAPFCRNKKPCLFFSQPLAPFSAMANASPKPRRARALRSAARRYERACRLGARHRHRSDRRTSHGDERATSWPAHGSRRRRESFLRRRRSCASAMRATTSGARRNATQCAESCCATRNRHSPPSRPSMLPFVVIAPVELLRLLVLRGARAVRWVFFASLASEKSRWGPAVRWIMIYARTTRPYHTKSGPKASVRTYAT